MLIYIAKIVVKLDRKKWFGLENEIVWFDSKFFKNRFKWFHLKIV